MRDVSGSNRESSLDYPPAERLDHADELHGTPVADPYRWLEDRQDPRTTEWLWRQDALYAAWLKQRPPELAEPLRQRLAELAVAGSVSVPVWRGARYFLTRRGPGEEHPVLSVTDPNDHQRPLIDPAALDPTGASTLDGWFPSADGDLLAYLLSAGGSERPILRVMEVATGRQIDGPIERAASHALAWLPDGTGFYYQRRPTHEQIADGVLAVHLLVYLHRIGTSSADDVLISRPELDVPKTSWYVPYVSADGRWLRLDADWGSTVDIYLADLTANAPDAPRFVPFQVGAEGITKPVFGRDGRIYALTSTDAPNRRLCVADPEQPGYEHWRTFVPEDPESVLEDFAILDTNGLDGEGLDRPLLLALRSRHALSELALHDLETGEPVADSEIALPGLGSIKQLAEHPDGGPYAYFSYTDFLTPPSVYRLDGRSAAVERWAASPGVTAMSPASATRVNQVTYSSADGTVVRMFILSPSGQPDRPRPTILYGYGAHGSSRTPAFNPLQLAWVEAGGVYAVANIRGGGEEGEAWHRAGMREHRQNTFADFHAAADYLVQLGWTTRDRLGLHGGSAGGQLVGVALTQRPDAYAAVLCSAPMIDMIRAELFGPAALWIPERGSVRDPEQFGWLLAQSPYHLVRDGAAYPAVLLTVFTGDARVDPMHAYKFAAALQHATSAPLAERPILLRREDDVGHSTRSASRSVALWAEQLGFFADRLGLNPAESF